MDIRELIVDIILTIVMVISTVALILRFWQDISIAIAATLMMLSLGGLFLSLHIRVKTLEKTIVARERNVMVNMQNISNRMAEKYDSTIAHLDDVLQALSKRVYR
jgi:hypothetical protein